MELMANTVRRLRDYVEMLIPDAKKVDKGNFKAGVDLKHGLKQVISTSRSLRQEVNSKFKSRM